MKKKQKTTEMMIHEKERDGYENYKKKKKIGAAGGAQLVVFVGVC